MVGKSNGGGSLETDWARAPPEYGSCCERFGRALYNPDDNSFFGRTPKRWGIVLVFYAVFYAVLAALFAVCMAGLFFVLEDDRPKYTLDSSLIGMNPGVSFRPRPLLDDGGFVLYYEVHDNEKLRDYLEQLETFFHPYKGDSWYKEQTECVAADNYGYPHTPCIFIKINKIYGWQPEYYTATSLPQDMDEDLRQYIREQTPQEQNQVWVTCWEERGNETVLEYPWGRALRGGVFPYTNTPLYRAPLLALRITLEVNKLTTVRCRAWAKNIIYSKSIKEPSGYARVQILLQDNTTTTTTTTTTTQ